VDVELEPGQPPEVAKAVSDLLVEPNSAPDPWWHAGLVEALDDPQSA
jgi:hypothetical protein